MTKKNPDVDNYIAGFSEETQKLLEEMRQTLHQAAPDAEEKIGYGIPTLTLNGNLLHFAGYKNHIGFYPAPRGLEAFKEELSGYKGAKGSVQFPLDRPLPLDLITRITKFRIEENLAKTRTKKKPASPRPKKLSDREQVTQHIQQLEPELSKIIETIRQIMLGIDEEIGEHIKWNNPTFYYTGVIKPFDPKEYKREIAVMNLYKGRIMMVFPSGSKIQDTSGLLEGDYRAANRKDGRKTVVFKDLDDVNSRKKQLEDVVKKWLTLVEK